MGARVSPLLVASFGNKLAGDDAFGGLVGDRVLAMDLPGVELANVGMQPFGLVHRLEGGRQGLVIVDASLATPAVPAGHLLDIDFFAPHEVPLVHDIALSTHGLSIADELELAKQLDILPPRVRLVTATTAVFVLGLPPTLDTQRLVEPAALCVARIAEQWMSENRSCQRA
jgi:hydrogenase maturation protease